MNRIIKDNRAQFSGFIAFFITAMLAVVIGLTVAWSVIDQAIYGGGGYAHGTYTFTGNTTDGEYVNVTTGLGTYAKSCFYFNTTGIGKPVGCLVVDVRSGANTSAGSATALKNIMNNDSDMNGSAIATNTTTTNVILTASHYGAAYNWASTDTVTNGGWGAAALSGGANTGTQNMSGSASTLVNQIPLFLVLVLLMLFVRAVI